MNRQKRTTLLLLVVLLALLIGAAAAYRTLSGRYKPADPISPVSDGQTTEADPAPSSSEGTADTADERTLAPDFTVYDREGNAVTLSSCRGKPVVVNFWATWCPPCRMELPYFDAAWAEYGDKIEFLMVDLTDGGRDTVESAAAFTDEAGYAYPLYFDTDFSGAAAYAINAVPLTVFVDADGMLAGTHLGALEEETLRASLDALLP